MKPFNQVYSFKHIRKNISGLFIIHTYKKLNNQNLLKWQKEKFQYRLWAFVTV